MSFRFENRSAGQHSAGGANLCRIVRRLGEENESIDAHAGKRRPILRVGPQPGRGETSEDAEAEARGIPPPCLVLVACDAPQLGELRVASLRVEAVAVLAGNRGHAWGRSRRSRWAGRDRSGGSLRVDRDYSVCPRSSRDPPPKADGESAPPPRPARRARDLPRR